MFGRDRSGRKETWGRVKKVGLRENPRLPQISERVVKSPERIKSRLLVTNIVAAVSYGFPARKGLELVDQLELGDELLDSERVLLEGGAAEKEQFHILVQSVYSLAWILRVVGTLDFFDPCPETLAASLPKLEIETLKEWRQTSMCRSVDEVKQKADEAYCCHWALRDAVLRGQDQFAVIEMECRHRRMAFEWLLQTEEWEDLDLST